MRSRRCFLQQSACAATAALAMGPFVASSEAAAPKKGLNMAFGLVTYQWGRDWDLPTLLTNCQQAKVLGVELRTTHAHRVEPTLSEQQRREVRKRFDDSPVTLVGVGSDERFDNPDPAVAKKAVEATKDFVRLSHDVGGTGVKVKPNDLHANVPHEKTIEQIGRSLNTLGEYAGGYGQQIRLEVHGRCAELPTMKAILDIADNENVALCWNSNPQDLRGKGLEHNYKLVNKRFGATVHTRELDSTTYPYQKLFKLLVDDDYNGWVMLEAVGKPKDRVAALAQQAKLFKELVKEAAEKG